MSAVTDLLAGMAGMLDTADVGTYRQDGTAYADGETAVEFKYLPTEPDRAVALTAYGATEDHPSIPLGRQSVQAKFRGLPDDDLDVDQLADDAFAVWHGATDLTFGSVHVIQILRASQIPLGRDEQGRRSLRADNYYVDLDYPPTPNRPT